MFRTLILSAVASVLPALATAAPIGNFTDLVVFGDSLSDPGNVFAATGGTTPNSTFYPNGQFTNGDTWATKLGAGFASGTNFAFGGAKASTDGDPSPDFALQIGAFQAASPTLGARPLTAVWFGGNDLRSAITAANPAAIVQQAVADVAIGVNTLLGLGLSDIVVFGLPNLGRIPEVLALGAGAVAQATNATLGFNAGLQFALAAPIASGNVSYFDSFAIFEEILANSGALGFGNVTDACLLNEADPTVCRGDAGYLFHDTIHPTDRVHSILAQEFKAAVVPLPAGALLLITAIGGLALMRRRTLA